MEKLENYIVSYYLISWSYYENLKGSLHIVKLCDVFEKFKVYCHFLLVDFIYICIES